MKRETIYLIIIAVLFLASGSGWFSSFSEKADKKQLEAENEVLAEASAMLLKENENLTQQVSERDTFIKHTTLAYDNLKQSLSITSSKIATTFPRYSTVLVAELDSQVVYLTNYISRADSIRR